MITSPRVWIFIWGIAFVVLKDAHAHGPQWSRSGACQDLSRLMPVHCSYTDPNGCCKRWHYNHSAPPAPAFDVSGRGSHCTRAVAARLAEGDAKRKCSGTWRFSHAELGGIPTPACPVEPHDSTGFSSNGVFDQITVHGECTR